jgi:outer membrane receptor protein involved in Fe transport
LVAARWARAFSVLLAGVAVLAAAGAFAAEPVKKSFNVPADSAERALKRFAEQSGVDVVFPTDVVSGVRTNPVQGELTAREALDRLLAGTGLVATPDARSGTFAVKRDPVPAKNAPHPGADSASATGSTVKMEAVEVVATKVDGLINKGLLQTGADAPVYHTVIDREEIAMLGVTSMDELFRYVPQTTTAQEATQTAVGSFGIGARISTTALRGFAGPQTIILVNGRPLPRTNNTTSGGADINRIPVAAIERIEILPMAGSAIYGSGAIGGAINVILRKNYSGRELTTYFGTSTDGGAGEYRFTFLEGRGFNHGKTNLTLTVSYQHRDPLRAGQREYLDEVLRRYGPGTTKRHPTTGVSAFETFTLPAFAGAPATILVNAAPTAAVNDLGIPGAPGVRFATIPAGTSPAQSTALTPASFTGTAGQFTPNRRYGRMILYEPIDASNINAQIEHKFIPGKLEAYGEFTLAYNRRNYTYPEVSSFALTATDPLNPFRTGVTPGFAGRAVTVFYDAPDVRDGWSIHENDSARAVLGLKGRISENWSWSVDGTIDYGHNASVVWTTLSNSGLTSFLALAPTTNTNVRRDLYPILADHTRFPIAPDVAAKYFAFRRANGHRSQQKEGNARVTGDLFQLPTGPLRTSATVKYRTVDLKGGFIQGGTPDYGLLVSGAVPSDRPTPILSTRKTWQGAVEAVVPVIGKSWRPLPIEALDLNLSASSESNNAGGINQSSQRTFSYPAKRDETYVAAAKLQLTRDLALRGSYSQGIYPPDWNDLSDLVTPQTVAAGTVADPKRGGTIQTTSWTLLNGGNPNLQPEFAKSRNLGLIFTPRFLPGLTLSADYWKTTKRDAIVRFNFVNVISSPDDFAGYIVRAAPTPDEAARGWLGVYTQITSGPVNVAQLNTDGIDFRGRYTWRSADLGQVAFMVNGSFTSHFQTRTLPTSSLVETAGAGGPNHWRAYSTLSWTKGAWGAALTNRYVGHYSSNTTTPTAVFPSATGFDGGRIPAFLTWETQLTYEVPYKAGLKGWRSWVAGTKWRLGVLNPFNDKPTFITDGAGFYNRQVDPRQRYVYLEAKKSY